MNYTMILHWVGILLATLGLGIRWGLSAGLPLNQAPAQKSMPLFAALVHGFGLILALAAGIMLYIERTGSYSTHTWIAIKFLAWLGLGGILTLAKRKPEKRALILGILATIFSAALVAVFLKP